MALLSPTKTPSSVRAKAASSPCFRQKQVQLALKRVRKGASCTLQHPTCAKWGDADSNLLAANYHPCHAEEVESTDGRVRAVQPVVAGKDTALVLMSGQQVAVTTQRIACKEHIVLATDGKWRMLLGGFVVQTLGAVATHWSADGGRYKYRTRFLELACCLASVENARGYSHLIDCFLRAAQAVSLPFAAG